jgi:SWI/SNF-related matrix-associated actin-dependent regulator 1 of chromatin subfamily A
MDKAPKELWNLIHYINPKDWHLKSVFTDRYCGGRAARGEGADRTEELNRRLRETGMVRRLKTEVLKELPAKVRQLVTVSCVDGMPTAGSVEELIKEASDKIRELEARKAKGNDEDHRAIVAEMNLTNFGFMSDMMKVRKQIGMAKVPGVSQSVAEVLDAYPDKKIILFGIHTDVIAAYESSLARFNPVTISGKVPVKIRQSLVDRFQEDESCRLFIGNITAAGVGLTLTRSDHVVMAEQEWGPAKMAQAEDRAHRIGQENSVLIQVFAAENSIDVHIAQLIIEKTKTVEACIDGRNEVSAISLDDVRKMI